MDRSKKSGGTPRGLPSASAVFFGPAKLLKRGITGMTSPLAALTDSVIASVAPRAAFSAGNTPRGASASRSSLPSPAEYPSLFDVRTPTAMDSSAALRPPLAVPSSRSASSRYSSSSQRQGSDASEVNDLASLDDAERASYLEVSHHNLYSVLSAPKSISNWGGALLDVLYQNPLEADIPIPTLSIPGLTDVSARDFEPYLKKHGQLARLYEDNHMLPINEQLTSSQVPSIEVADQDVAMCLSAVPDMFFRPDFDLTDPAVFEQVMNLQTNMSLQDALSGYLDRVEFTLLRQVSSRSDRFFEASADQEVMRQSIKDASDHVATLRDTMDRLRNGLADKSLDIVGLHRRQKRVAELHEVVTLIESVKNAESAVDALVQCQDYASALDLIESSQTTLREQLNGIHGLTKLNEKFQAYHGFIASQMSQRFISAVTSTDWSFSDQDKDDGFAAEHGDTETTQQEKEAHTREIKLMIASLFRQDVLGDVVAKYRDHLTEEIKVVVKTVVTETIASSATSQVNGSGEANGSADSKISLQLRALSSDDFLQCVQMIFEHLLLVLRRAVLVQHVLTKEMQKMLQEDAIESSALQSAMEQELQGASESTELWTPEGISVGDKEMLGDWKKKSKCEKTIRDIEDVVQKTCEFSQRSVSNLFSVRKDVQAVYSMPQLRLLYDTTMEFVVTIEKLTGKTDYTLRGALFSQLKVFLEKYHQVQMNKLISTLDHELWKSTEISVARHQALEDLSSGRGVSLILSSDRDVTAETASPFKALTVCGKTFRVVWSVLLMLEIVMNYMSCAANFPVLATDVLQRSIEIFRIFNSRTTQLVLGAGAMQMARLKSISARHLALASQSLDLTMTLIPHIKAALAAHFNDRQRLLLEEFDRVQRDYAEHNDKIFSKFTNIVEDQIMKRFLENVHNEVNYDTPSLAVPTRAMLGIQDNTLKLHAVLSPILSALQMKDVMTRVFDMFTQKLPECFKQVQPSTPAGKKRVVDDIVLFVQSFSNVPAVQFDGDALVRHFKRVYLAS